MIAIYARQSIDKKDSISIDVQIEVCRKEVAEGEIRVFSDKGYSGKSIDRPAFTSLLESVERGEIEKVIVYRLDRISRSISDFAKIMGLFNDKGVSFVSCNEKFDTSTPMGNAMLYIIMVFAQLERETIAERIRDNYYARGKNGVFLGGPPPLGFTNADDYVSGKKIRRLVPTEDINIVKYIFNEYAYTNKSLGEIARNAQSKFGNGYGVWNNIKLSRILSNPVYVKADADVYALYSSKGCIIVNDIEEFTGMNACYVFGKRDRSKSKYRNLEEHIVALATHEGVIDSRTFILCHEKLKNNRQIKNTGTGKHTWLSGLMFCEYCHHRYIAKKDRTQKRYLYCGGRQNNLCDRSHKMHQLNAIEAYADNAIRELLAEYQNRTIQTETQEPNNRQKIALVKLENQIQNLLDSIANAEPGTIPYLTQRVNELVAQKQEIQSKVINATRKEIRIPSVEEWENGDMETKKEIAYNLLEKIVIGDDSINLYWRA